MASEKLLEAAIACAESQGVSVRRGCVVDDEALVQTPDGMCYRLARRFGGLRFERAYALTIEQARALAQLGYLGTLPAPEPTPQLPDGEQPKKRRWWEGGR